MKSIGVFLKDHLGEIMVEWNAVAVEEPWIALPHEQRIDSLPGVLENLIDVALLNPRNADAHRQLMEMAAMHGIHRRESGFDNSLIFREYYLLRNAIWSVLGENGWNSDAFAAMIQIDAVIHSATRASLFGFFQEEMQSSGTYKDRMDQLALDSQNLLA